MQELAVLCRWCSKPIPHRTAVHQLVSPTAVNPAPPWARLGLLLGGLLVAASPWLPWFTIVLIGDLTLVHLSTIASAPAVPIMMAVTGAAAVACGALLRSPTAARVSAVTFGGFTVLLVGLLLVEEYEVVAQLGSLAEVAFGPWVALAGSLAAFLGAAVPAPPPETSPPMARSSYSPVQTRYVVPVALVLGAAVALVGVADTGWQSQVRDLSAAAPPATSAATKHQPDTLAEPTQGPTPAPSGSPQLLPIASATPTPAQPPAPDPGAPGEVYVGNVNSAEALIAAHGYTPNTAPDWSDGRGLHVITATATGSADGYAQRAFFFYNDYYLGTDAKLSSATITEAWSTGDTVALNYQLYKPDDPACCPTAGSATVRFHWSGHNLRPLDPIPPADPNSQSSRR
ncbi:LppP/LprE family lipoprotein [Amycolatopsis sp. NPDC051045]|uniref:LppP/LprE family lipoprotein n=1 Tax=Amycolatopsis sp. NPDC051045 TaxID=3156922 RepID=UPI00343A400E